MLRLVVLTTLFLLCFSTLVLPHNGKLDKNGCHNDRVTGTYHCHGGQMPLLSSMPPLRDNGNAKPLPSRTRAYDGDDLKFKDKRPRVRLVGCDTPEKPPSSQCDFEKTLAKSAKKRLQQLIDTNRLELQYVACSCRPGTHGTKDCNKGRDCGIVRYNGKNVCDILISEGLAHVYKCSVTMCPKQEIGANNESEKLTMDRPFLSLSIFQLEAEFEKALEIIDQKTFKLISHELTKRKPFPRVSKLSRKE